MNQKAITYAKETKNAVFQGKTITVTHITPILTPEEREKLQGFFCLPERR